MRSTGRTGVLAIAASLALTAGALTVVVPASATGETEFIDGGQLTLTTSTTAGPINQVTYTGTEYTGANQPLTTTTLTISGAKNCDLATPAAGPLLAFTGYLGDPLATPPVSSTVGFKGGSLGVNEEIDSLCSRVDTISKTSKTEYLDVALSDKLVNYGGRQMLAKSASLDIEVKQSGLFNTTKAKVKATALRDGADVGSFTLIQAKAPSPVPPNTFYCDVKDTQNCQWQIALPSGVYFDTLRLKAESAGFSLEGGSDGAPTLATTFDLVSEVDKEFLCVEGENVTNGVAKVTYAGSTGAQCDSFGVVLEGLDQEVTFLKPLSVTPDAQFIFDIDWKLPRPTTPAFTVPDATIDFEFKDDKRIPAGETSIPEDKRSVMEFCPAYLYSGTGGNRALTGLKKPGPDALDAVKAAYEENLRLLGTEDMVFESDAASATGTQFACIADTRTTKYTDGNLIVEDTIYLIGDAKMRL